MLTAALPGTASFFNPVCPGINTHQTPLVRWITTGIALYLAGNTGSAPLASNNYTRRYRAPDRNHRAPIRP